MHMHSVHPHHCKETMSKILFDICCMYIHQCIQRLHVINSMIVLSPLHSVSQTFPDTRGTHTISIILSMSEVRQMLRDVAWREAMDSWKEEARSHSKLAEVQKLIEKGYEARCVEVRCKWRRRVLVQLRGGTAALEVETGRWRGVSREGRVCRNCRSEEVENVEHWLLRCTGMAEEREKLIRTMREKVEWQSMEDDERVAAVLSYACRDDGVGRGVEKMWRKHFFDRSLTVPAPPPPPPPLIPNV